LSQGAASPRIEGRQRAKKCLRGLGTAIVEIGNPSPMMGAIIPN